MTNEYSYFRINSTGDFLPYLQIEPSIMNNIEDICDGVVMRKEDGHYYQIVADVFEASWFGLIGDGITPNDDAFQKMSDACKSAGGATFNIKKGLYIFNAMIGGAGKYKHKLPNNMTLIGDGMNLTTFKFTHPRDNGFLFGDRTADWEVHGICDDKIFTYKQANIGDHYITLKNREWAEHFQIGHIIAINNGAHYYDQQFCELNKIIKIDNASGKLFLEFPLARAYSPDLAQTWGRTTSSFAQPPIGQSVTVQVDAQFPSVKQIYVSLGENIYRIVDRKTNIATLLNIGCGNDPEGNEMSAQSACYMRIITISDCTQNFIMSGIHVESPDNAQVIRHLRVNACYNIKFKDCHFSISNKNNFSTLNAALHFVDMGTNIQFSNCLFDGGDTRVANQNSRSSGRVIYQNCQFVNVNIDYSEYSYETSWINCKFSNISNIVLGNSTFSSLLEGCTFHSSASKYPKFLYDGEIQNISNIQKGRCIVRNCQFTIEPDLNKERLVYVYMRNRGGYIEYSHCLFEGKYLKFNLIPNNNNAYNSEETAYIFDHNTIKTEPSAPYGILELNPRTNNPAVEITNNIFIRTGDYKSTNNHTFQITFSKAITRSRLVVSNNSFQGFDSTNIMSNIPQLSTDNIKKNNNEFTP